PATAKAPSDKVQALIARNAENSCTKCHGANFNTPNDATVPKLAGQYGDYLFVALKAYKTSHPMVGRSNAVRSTQVQPYSNAELKQLAQSIASLPGELKAVPVSELHRTASK
uniref:c-type cytochrome n=1 Tax=Shigella flexneri TaxID=623 RepID=UPI001C0A7229